MISDSSKGIFDIVLVHKLDRFSIDRYNSAIYKKRLKKNHVTLCSVLEKMDDSPESIMMESVLEGMAEYYSKNLAREVMKGMNETALQCKHTGGSTPLGFDLDHEKHLVINPHEAEAVKIIFEMYDNGYGYSDIIRTLNSNGYTTKKGCTFGKNSLYEILGNEKYTGTFVFNRLSGSEDGKRNNHKYKSTNSAIRIEGGCPQIISKELFDRVQQRRENNKQRCGKYHSTEFYLLTGKVFCGICGKRMIGNVRYSGRSKLRLATYRCNTHRIECKNKELNKDYLDTYVQKLLQEKIFNQGALKKTVTHINQYIHKYNQQYESHYSSVTSDYQEVLQNLNNITKAIERGILTDSIIKRAEELEAQKTALETKLQEMHQLEEIAYSDVAELLTTWKSLKPCTEEFRTFVQQYVKQITVYPYHFEVILDKGLSVTKELTEIISLRRGELYAMFDSRVRE